MTRYQMYGLFIQSPLQFKLPKEVNCCLGALVDLVEIGLKVCRTLELVTKERKLEFFSLHFELLFSLLKSFFQQPCHLQVRHKSLGSVPLHQTP